MNIKITPLKNRRLVICTILKIITDYKSQINCTKYRILTYLAGVWAYNTFGKVVEGYCNVNNCGKQGSLKFSGTWNRRYGLNHK